jgi:predicted transcriptional regulator
MSDPTRHRRGRGGQGGHEPSSRIRTRELRAIELSVLGWSQHQIAGDLGISQAAVSKLLKRVEERMLRELTETMERHKARQTQRLEHHYAEAMRAWDQSKADSTRKRQRKTQGGSGGNDATLAEVVSENQHGDPRYLEVARKALADVRKVWGLDAPHQLDVQTQSPYQGLTEEELRQELAHQQRLLNPASLDDRLTLNPDTTAPAPVASTPDPAPSPEQDPAHADHD